MDSTYKKERIFSSNLLETPGTDSNASTDSKGPFSFLWATMAEAVFVPMPGRQLNSCSLAELTSTRNRLDWDWAWSMSIGSTPRAVTKYHRQPMITATHRIENEAWSVRLRRRFPQDEVDLRGEGNSRGCFFGNSGGDVLTTGFYWISSPGSRLNWCFFGEWSINRRSNVLSQAASMRTLSRPKSKKPQQNKIR